MRGTCLSLYEDMCRNTFVAMARGPGHLKQYIEHVQVRHRGLMIANAQFFDAVRQQNDAIRDAIDLTRRRLYAVRVGCELAMVVIGAGTIPILLQVGVGLGYVLVTNVITAAAVMEKADIVAMPGKVTKSALAGVAGNLAQEGVDIAADQIRIFEKARELSYAREQARIARRIEQIVAEGKRRGGNRAELRKLGQLQKATAAAATQAESSATRLASLGAQGLVRAAGVAVGVYFMKEDLGNVLSFMEEGALWENPPTAR